MKKRTTRPNGLSRRGVISALAAAGRWKKEREWSGKCDRQADQQGRRLELGWEEKGPRPRGAPARLFAGRRDSRGRGFDDHCFSGRGGWLRGTLVMRRRIRVTTRRDS